MSEPTKNYRGQRLEGANIVGVGNGLLPLRLDLRHFSGRFDWGRDTAGTSQLAFAMFADCLGDDNQALRLWFEYKWLYVVKFPLRVWRVSEVQVREAVRGIDQAKKPIP